MAVEQSETPVKKRRKRWSIGYKFSRFKFRLCDKLERKKAFIFSFVITYILTIGLSAALVAIQIDKERSSLGADETLSLDYNECTDVTEGQFWIAKLLETLIPTAITFSGTILILQTDHSTRRGITVWLFVNIALIAIGGFVLPTAKTPDFLNIYLWIWSALCVISIVLSWCAFSDSETPISMHKREPCDGQLVF